MRETTLGAAMTDYNEASERERERQRNYWFNEFVDSLAMQPQLAFLWKKTKLQLAQEYAAGVRSRHPEMQVRRIAK